MPRPAGAIASPSEAAIRSRLVAGLVAGQAALDAAAVVVHELGLGRGSARADLVVISADAIVGLEIKSAADSLKRLPNQAAWYGRVCDRCVLAGDPTHVEEAGSLLPDWWGLTTVDGAGQHELRAPGANPEQDPEALASMLWMPELKAAVAAAGQDGGTAGLERADLVRVLAAAAGTGTAALVREQLLGRRWVDVQEPQGAVRVVRQPEPTRKVARRARVVSKHERRLLKRPESG